MKRETMGIWVKAVIWAALILVGAPLFWILLERVFDGWGLDLAYRFLFPDGGSTLDWARLWKVVVGAAVAFPLLTVLLCAISSSRAVKKRLERQSRSLEKFLEQLSSGQEPEPLPPRLSMAEREMLSLKREAQLAREQARMEMQRKNDLITYLAHDLRTPLASVLGYVTLLTEAPDLPQEQRAKYTGIALDKARRLEQLIDELFDIIRFNLQTLALNIESIRLPFMLEQLADEFYPLLLPDGKRIRVDAEKGLMVEGDPDKLARVLNNILKNAAAYSDPGTEILVRAKPDGDWVRLEIENQGDPIPEHKQKAIFEKFYRLDSSRSTQTGGAGLGLAIAKQIVEAHGGKISVMSDRDRTVFSVRLPVRQGDRNREDSFL